MRSKSLSRRDYPIKKRSHSYLDESESADSIEPTDLSRTSTSLEEPKSGAPNVISSPQKVISETPVKSTENANAMQPHTARKRVSFEKTVSICQSIPLDASLPVAASVEHVAAEKSQTQAVRRSEAPLLTKPIQPLVSESTLINHDTPSSSGPPKNFSAKPYRVSDRSHPLPNHSFPPKSPVKIEPQQSPTTKFFKPSPTLAFKKIAHSRNSSSEPVKPYTDQPLDIKNRPDIGKKSGLLGHPVTEKDPRSEHTRHEPLKKTTLDEKQNTEQHRRRPSASKNADLQTWRREETPESEKEPRTLITDPFVRNENVSDSQRWYSPFKSGFSIDLLEAHDTTDLLKGSSSQGDLRPSEASIKNAFYHINRPGLERPASPSMNSLLLKKRANANEHEKETLAAPIGTRSPNFSFFDQRF